MRIDCFNCHHAPCICDMRREMAQLETDKIRLEAQVSELERVIEALLDMSTAKFGKAQEHCKKVLLATAQAKAGGE